MDVFLTIDHYKQGMDLDIQKWMLNENLST
jgi:hypothetical protein